MSQIKAGDLVMVVHPSVCPAAKDPNNHMGRVFRVLSVANGAELRCDHCGEQHDIGLAAEDEHVFHGFYRLKKIDPLGESTDKREELTA